MLRLYLIGMALRRKDTLFSSKNGKRNSEIRMLQVGDFEILRKFVNHERVK